MIQSFDQLIYSLPAKSPKRCAVINPQSDYLLDCLSDAEKRGWITPVLYQDESPEISAQKAVTDTAKGKNDLIMKGDIDTATLLKAVLDKSNNLRTNRILSHIAVVNSPQYSKLMLMTDGGIHPSLDKSTIISMIENGLILSHALGIHHPKVAMLSLVEKVTPKIPETVLAQELVNHFSTDSRMIIEGPMALDVALSKDAAKAKGLQSEIAGQTDIFVGPSITTTNFMVKALMSIGQSKGGGIILGAKVPIILLSRSDTPETKLHSIALGLTLLKGN